MHINLIFHRLGGWLKSNSLPEASRLTDIFTSQACGPSDGYDEWVVADYFEERFDHQAFGSPLEPADKLLAFFVWFMCLSTKPRNTMWVSGFVNPQIARVGLIDVDLRRVLVPDRQDVELHSSKSGESIRRPKVLGREPGAFFRDRPFGTLIFGDLPPTLEMAIALTRLDCRLDSDCECLVVKSSGHADDPPLGVQVFPGFDVGKKPDFNADLPRRNGTLVKVRYYSRVS